MTLSQRTEEIYKRIVKNEQEMAKKWPFLRAFIINHLEGEKKCLPTDSK